MLKLLRLFIVMLRYRVAITILLFFLLGVAFHQEFTTFSLNYLWAIVALASSYVAATTLNDIADKEIDRVNHPSSLGRPLVRGEATEKDLYLLHILAAIVTLGLSFFIGAKAVWILMLSLVINYLYSLSPFKISHRTHFAPLILSVAYVLIPYWLGATIINSTIQNGEWIFVCALLSLFFGRIILKDFRDRKGDALYGKPTFLLRYGKPATCLISFASILLGNILFVASLPTVAPMIFFILELYFFAIFFVLYKLWKAESHENEQAAIGIGAKMGNGLLLTILGLFVLLEYDAPGDTQILFSAVITSMFLLNFLILVARPNYAVIGYRG